MSTLGLDSSTSTCGWSFADNGVILDAGFLNTSKLSTNREKSLAIVSLINSNPLVSNLDWINLEAALSGFGGGFTSQQTLIMLSRFNAVLEYVLGETYTNVPVNLVNVSTARKKVFGKSSIKGMKPKDYVKMMIPKVVPDVARFEKINKRGGWDVKNGDMYDACVMALFGRG